MTCPSCAPPLARYKLWLLDSPFAPLSYLSMKKSSELNHTSVLLVHTTGSNFVRPCPCFFFFQHSRAFKEPQSTFNPLFSCGVETVAFTEPPCCFNSSKLNTTQLAHHHKVPMPVQCLVAQQWLWQGWLCSYVASSPYSSENLFCEYICICVCVQMHIMVVSEQLKSVTIGVCPLVSLPLLSWAEVAGVDAASIQSVAHTI